MTWLVLGAVVPSLLVSWTLTFVVRRLAPRFGLIDKPAARKVHVTPTPLGGGIAIWLGVILPLIGGLWIVDRTLAGDLNWPLPSFIAQHLAGIQQQSGRLLFLLAAGSAMALLGLVDDKRGLDWRLRLFAQTLVAAIIAWQGFRLTLFIDAPLLTGVLTVIWIVGLINSFNMLDNMDGLSGGVAAIAAGILAAVMLLTPNPETGGPQLFVGGFLVVLVGALLGFLCHNRPPARIFMGDAGSYFVGFYIAVATLMATYAGENLPRHAILAPLCVLAVPIYDTVTVILIRLRHGRSPFHADKNHFSHRLVELGLSKPQAVLTIYLMTATCGLGALLLHQVNAWGAVVVLAIVCCVLLLVLILEVTARRRRDGRTN